MTCTANQYSIIYHMLLKKLAQFTIITSKCCYGILLFRNMSLFSVFFRFCETRSKRSVEVFRGGSGTSPLRFSPIIGENLEHVLAKVQWSFANWRIPSGYAGECLLNFHQLATFQRIYWRMSREYIGKSRINFYRLKWSIYILRDI